jgi:hypothetical protein
MAQMTMGCGRRADSLKMALGWIYYGKEGYQRKSSILKLHSRPWLAMACRIPNPCQALSRPGRKEQVSWSGWGKRQKLTLPSLLQDASIMHLI